MSERQIVVSEAEWSEILTLSRRLEDLIERIASRSSSSRPAGSSDPSAVSPGVADEDEFQAIHTRSIPSGFFSLEEIKLLHSGLGVETGPPPVPEALLVLARDQLDPSGVGQDARARRAFGLGFWAKVSVDCHIPLLADRNQVPLSIPSTHWIVLRSQKVWTLDQAARFDSYVDFQRFVGESDTSLVAADFPSLCEVHLFAAGAGIWVPHLLRWTNRA